MWVDLDYRILTEIHHSGTLTWTLEGNRTLHGFGMWFDSELAEGVGFSGAPDQPPLFYQHSFFPFQEPLEGKSGDVLAVSIAGYSL